MVKKENKMAVMMDLDHNLFNSKLWSIILFPLIIIIINIDVDVLINDYHHHLAVVDLEI